MIMQWYPVAAAELPTVIAMDIKALADWIGAEDRPAIDVDKAWQGIHTVLTGAAWPEGHELDALVFGGTPIGGEELSYGPARYLGADDVAALATLLEPIEVADFEARIDLALLARLDVYPQVWDRQDEADVNKTYLADGYALLREAFRSSKANDEAMVVALI
jgi:hypothetical protein